MGIRQERVGFVPTLGALHAGHRSLLQRARRTCDLVVASVFINPLQFGPTEDFHRYPRTLGADKSLCKEEGIDLLFLPTQDQMFPADFQTTVTVNRLTADFEGQKRPHHFQGVTTIVTKLFTLVRPDFAFFGQKDYQQLLVVKQLVKDLHLGVHIIECPTVRERDGLALSSRNQYLGSRHREEAREFYQSLRLGARLIRQGGRQPYAIEKAMADHLTRTTSAKIDYLKVCDPSTLKPVKTITGQAVLLGAIQLGKVRLIDNMRVRAPKRI